MQGQGSAIGSFPGFEHGSASSDAGIDQQICWNNMQNSAHNNMIPDYMTSPGDLNDAYLNSMSQGGHNLSGWSGGEPSYTRAENNVSHDEWKAEHGWSTPMVACGAAGPVLEERQYEPDNSLSLSNATVNCTSNLIANGPLFVPSSSNAISQDLNMSAGFVGQGGDDCHMMDCSNAYKSDGSENLRIPFASSSSDPFGLPSGSGYLEEEKDGRPACSLDGRRLSCKRKVLDRNSGQSSLSASSSSFQQAESSVWHAVSGRYNAGSSLSISTPSENIIAAGPSEQVNSRVGLVAAGAASESPLALNVARNAESSHRNYRARTSPSRQQDSVPTNVFSTGNTVGHSVVPPQQQSLRLLPPNNALHMRPLSAADNTGSQRQSTVVHAPAFRPIPRVSRWNGGFIPRRGLSSSSAESEPVPHGESSSISVPRNISEHPMFIPANEMRNSAQNSPNWSLTGGNTNLAGNVASTSRIGTSSRVPQSSGPNRVPHRNPPQYPRRLSDLVRRSLLSSAGFESGGQSSSSSSVPSGPPSQEMELSSGAGDQGNQLSHTRSAMLLERQLDGGSGIPHSLRALAAASEGRSRLVSEIRGVLDLMRRGEGLRFEDVMILDQSVFFGMGNIHDRHRDMRLDVDNMSYEELLALEERIGDVNTGLTEETILNRLKQRKYFSIAMVALLEVEEPCCVCQEEYNEGEHIGTLECGHEFHTECIKQWLMHKNLCPICKTTALNK